jgi:hypothetical protein
MKPLRSTIWRTTGPILALLFAVSLTLSNGAHAAGTAAGTRITNTATVSYNNSAGVGQTPQTATANVNVTLLAAEPTVVASTATATTPEGTPVTVTYTVFSNANGSDSYTVVPTETPGADMSTVAPGAPSGGSPITLAATSLAAATNGTNVITVPWDRNSGTGILVNTVLRINGVNYTVNAIAPDTPASQNTTQLTLSGSPPAGIAIGTDIGEVKTITVTYPTGTVLTGGANNTQTGTLTVTGTGPSGSASTVITVTPLPASLSIAKTACNGTTTPAGTPACFTAGATNARPLNTLIYKVVVQNTGTGVAKAVDITDVIQRYLTYVAGGAKYTVGANGAPSTTVNYTDGSLTALTEGAGGYSYTAGTRTVRYLYPSDLAAGNELVLFYTATVD